MFTRSFLACFFTLLTVLTGCISPPAKHDPFAELNITDSVETAQRTYPNIPLALLYSKNTVETREYLRKFAGSAGALFRHNYWPSAKFDVDQVFGKFTSVLERHFQSVRRIEDLADAAPGGAALVAMLDITGKIAPPPASRTTTLDATMIFLTPDKRQVAVLKGAASIEIGKNRNNTGIPDAAAQVLAQLDRDLAVSRALAQFSSGGSQTAPAALAAPAKRTYQSDVDTPGYSLPEQPNNFALVVGIDEYANLPKADFAARDAQAVYAHLVAIGYPRKNIINLTGTAAGKTGIEKYLNEWLPRNVGENSKVFVYFSGHGAPEPESGEAYLMPWDADAKFLATTGLPIKQLYRKLNALKASQVIVAMDACFSGAGGRSVVAKGLRPLVTKVDTAVESVGNLVVLSASGSDEVTGSLEDQGHGLFTYHLLKGLQARRGEATLQELFDYLNPAVQEGARRDNRDQSPSLLPAGSQQRKAATLR